MCSFDNIRLMYIVPTANEIVRVCAAIRLMLVFHSFWDKLMNVYEQGRPQLEVYSFILDSKYLHLPSMGMEAYT